MQSKKTETSYIIQDIIQEPSEVRVYRFLHGLKPFEFGPGDFVVARLGNSSDLRASLTLASSPNDKTNFEVLVKRTGDFGTQFYERADIGSTVHLLPPTRALQIDIDDQPPLCFLCHDYTVPAARCALLAHVEASKTRPIVLIQELEADSTSPFAGDFTSSDYGHFLWHQIGPEQLSERVLRKVLGEFDDWVFVIQAEGAQAKRYGTLLKELGVDSSRVMKERWS